MSIFSSVPVKKVKKTKFDLSHEKKLSMKMGKLYPVLVQEILPSDSFRVNSQVFLRFAPLIAPVMERFYCNIHYFFVPNRLVWEDWEDFITGGEDGTLTPSVPKISVSSTTQAQYATGTLADYLGIPDPEGSLSNAFSASQLPFRAYTLIYNEYYRDQNLEDEIDITDTTQQATLRSRAWKKDYFTSALPFAQRGQEVTLPFNDINYSITSSVIRQDSNPADGPLAAATGVLQDGTSGARIENIESIGAPTINELRKAYRLQEWLENNARGGARYIEQIMSHFNQRSSDSRLQRPEYLGGGKTDVVISEVLNTAGYLSDTGDAGGYQGRMAGHAVSLGKTNSFKRKFEEHGFVLGLMSVMSYPTYFQGLHRMWQRYDKLDYAWPEFANLGEQEILNQELFIGTTTANREDVFGYTPRYSEYKYHANSIHGDFKTTLSFWNYAQKFNSRPALNTDFIQWTNDNRIFNVDDQERDNVYAQVKHNISAIRPLPYFGVPRT